MTESERESGGGLRERLLPKKPSRAGSYVNEVLFGLINVIVGVPTMVSYAAIVYQGETITGSKLSHLLRLLGDHSLTDHPLLLSARAGS